ncbi:MAG: alpha/beta fold hydrolase, partial [Candidatus Puniceispirillum sp.]
TPVEAYIGTGMAIRDADFRDKAPSIDVPVTCVVGDQDGATPPELVESTAKLIPGATFKVIKDAGHIPCAEQPAALIAIIRTMIGKI